MCKDKGGGMVKILKYVQTLIFFLKIIKGGAMKESSITIKICIFLSLPAPAAAKE